jgi:hypothetical protein
LKEQLLDEVPTRIRVRERVRLCVGLLETALSDSDELEHSDLGGDSVDNEIRSYILRVRRIGPLISL